MIVHHLHGCDSISSFWFWAILIDILTEVGLMSTLWLMVYKIRLCDTSEDTHGHGNNKPKPNIHPVHIIRSKFIK